MSARRPLAVAPPPPEQPADPPVTLTQAGEALRFFVRQAVRRCLAERGLASAPRYFPPGHVVYFVRAGEAIKIGFAKDVARRVRSLQTGQAQRLELLGTIPGDRQRERDLHARFYHLRIRGEWHRSDKELLDFIDAETDLP